MMILVLSCLFSISFIAAFCVFKEAHLNGRIDKSRYKGSSLKKQPLARGNSNLGQTLRYPEKPSSEEIGIPKSLSEKSIVWNQTFLKKLEWKLFEDICMEYLRIKHCDANVTCTGADGGIDITVKDKQGNKITLGQCKAWNKPIGVSLIRELFGVMAAERVRHGVFLTTSVFSNEAKHFAHDKPLMLIDCNEFVKLINRLNLEEKNRLDKLIANKDCFTPTCVRCNVKLIKRTAKSGPKAGQDFWGCVNYPRCKITMKISKAI